MNFETFDAPYVDRLRKGDEATAQHFHKYFGELITLKVRSRLPTRQAVEDVRQETFSRFFVLLHSENGIRQAERLGPLVNSICNNVLFEQYRSLKRADPLDEEQARQLVDSRSDALHDVISTETSKSVHDTLLTLSDRDRDILQAVFLQDRDKDLVCKEMGIDRGYMRVLIHRAKQSFRRQYTKKTGGRMNLFFLFCFF